MSDFWDSSDLEIPDVDVEGYSLCSRCRLVERQDHMAVDEDGAYVCEGCEANEAKPEDDPPTDDDVDAMANYFLKGLVSEVGR